MEGSLPVYGCNSGASADHQSHELPEINSEKIAVGGSDFNALFTVVILKLP
jgi:hypothetical protein